MNEDKIKYFVYARKSQESDEKQVQSLRDQVNTAKEIQNKYGLEVVDIIQESKSAKTPHNRPEFSAMLDRIESGEATGIICWKLDRISRNQLESGLIGQMLEDRKIEIIRTDEKSYRPEDNVVLYGIETAMATQYSKELSKNVKRGMDSKVNGGDFGGRSPLGYLNDKNTRTITLDTERVPLIRKMWELAMQGHSPRWIADYMNEQGFTTPRRGQVGGGPISHGAIYKMFENPFYAGKFLWLGQVHDGNHEAMVSQEEFDLVQKRIKRSDKKRNPKDKQEKTYAGLFKCPCGCSYTGYTKKEMYTYWKCSKNVKGTSCNAKQVSENLLTKRVTQQLEKLEMPQELLDWAMAIVDKKAEQEQEKSLSGEAMKTKTLSSKKAELQNWKSMLAKGFATETDFLEAKTTIEAEIKELEIVEERQADVSHKKEELKDRLKFMTSLVTTFGDRKNKQAHRYVLSMIGEGHTILDKQPVLGLYSFLQPVRLAMKKLHVEARSGRTQHNGFVSTLNADLDTVCPVLCG